MSATDEVKELKRLLMCEWSERAAERLALVAEIDKLKRSFAKYKAKTRAMWRRAVQNKTAQMTELKNQRDAARAIAALETGE